MIHVHISTIQYIFTSHHANTQACYGIVTIPKGEWLCKACLAGEDEPECVLCPNRGGALKRVRPGNTSWAHLSCALWIPEVRLGNIEKMEPITNVDAVPVSLFKDRHILALTGCIIMFCFSCSPLDVI